jgi:hypothetical protein
MRLVSSVTCILLNYVDDWDALIIFVVLFFLDVNSRLSLAHYHVLYF